ncbi:MAG: winged helix DNA-binding protein, partial [Oscillospiraceae bacterium]|nr:winged helix DNA-binding protein [Oscillospiraceae bacterium]
TINRLSIEKKADKIKVSEIVKCLEVPNAGVSRTLGKLEEKGLVFRSIDSMDRRNIYVTITENGKKLLCECQKNVDKFLNRVKEKFGKEKSEQLQTLMDEFAKIWKEEMKLLNEKNK